MHEGPKQAMQARSITSNMCILQEMQGEMLLRMCCRLAIEIRCGCLHGSAIAAKLR
jgi:hypothetical protein